MKLQIKARWPFHCTSIQKWVLYFSESLTCKTSNSRTTNHFLPILVNWFSLHQRFWWSQYAPLYYCFADVIKLTVNVGVVVGDERLSPIRQGKYKYQLGINFEILSICMILSTVLRVSNLAFIPFHLGCLLIENLVKNKGLKKQWCNDSSPSNRNHSIRSRITNCVMFVVLKKRKNCDSHCTS